MIGQPWHETRIEIHAPDIETQQNLETQPYGGLDVARNFGKMLGVAVILRLVYIEN